MVFKTSVNIKFDMGKEEFLKRYIPTPSHSEALIGLIDGFVDKESNHAHIIIGPYGTGKSLLANVIGSIVSRLATKREIDALIDKFNQVDENLHTKLIRIEKLERTYIPITLSGNEGKFRKTIISSILKKLKDQGIEVILPGLVSKVVDSITTWKEQFPQTYNEFIAILKEDGKKIDIWYEEVLKQNEKEILYFSNVYPRLTSGVVFDVNYDYSFLSQMEYIINVLKQQNVGVFIIYDEFARFLQGLNKGEFNETMQDIQDLAELVNRTDLIQLLLISHKSLRQYFSVDHEDVAKEFQRIEKRFNQYLIHSDQATFLRIAEQIVSENVKDKPEISPKDFCFTQDHLRKYHLFPSLNQTERDELIVKRMYPLHPVSLFMLPHLTRVFGQNERTLFTFLESQETSGLLNHIQKSDSYYLPNQLFDFFFPDSNYYHEEFSEQFNLYKKAIARIPADLKQKQDAINLIKIVALWNICSLQNEVKLSNDFLSFCINSSYAQIEYLLRILSNNKIVRYNRVNSYWELFEGNTIDLLEKIDQERQLLKLNVEEEYEVLHDNLKRRFYFPEAYNDDKGMTRYALVKIVFAEELINNNGVAHYSEQEADLMIIYVLCENDKSIGKVTEILLGKNEGEPVLFYVHKSPVGKVRTEIANNITLKLLANNKKLKDEDKGISEEIDLLLQESNYLIQEYLDQINLYENKREWIIDGKKYDLASESDLSNELSRKCNKRFNQTPVILNDSFNRKKISGAQRTAVIKLIDSIIDEPQKDQFNIVGNGPEYAIYASVFKNNGGLDKNINMMSFADIKYQPYRELRNAVLEQLDTNPNGNFQDIINIFTNEPYGIRISIVPLLFVSLIRDRWNEFMLYRNGMYVPGLKGEKLFEIISQRGANNYEYVYDKLSEEYIAFFAQIEKIFGDHIEQRLSNESKLIFMCGTLMKWLRSLPRIVQLTSQVDDEFYWLRNCIKRSEIAPQESIAQIIERYKEDIDGLVIVKQNAERFINKIKSDLCEEIYAIFGVNSFDELKKQTALKYNTDSNISNNLLRSLYRSLDIYDEKGNWYDNFIEEYIGVKVDNWSDTTHDLFIGQMNHDYYSLTSNSNPIHEKEKETVVIQLNDSKTFISEVDLSVKSNTVFDNLVRMLNTAGRNIPKQELEFLVYKLFEKYVITAE